MEALEGARVAVRIVERSDPETLVAACRGHLGAPTPGKHPALLWPVPAGSETSLATWKNTRTHLRRRRFRGSVANPGRTILHIVQGPVIVNVRGL